MKIFGKGRPPDPPRGLADGEPVERSVKATLLYGKERKKGALHLTDRRLMFEADRGDARYMVVPFVEMKSVGLYPWPGAPMGLPSSLRQCLVVETDAGEQVWWDFNEKEERAWLPLVKERVETARATAPTGSEPP